MKAFAALNDLAVPEAEAALLRCCGSIRWARLLAAQRPFYTRTALIGAARDVWRALMADDWRQAFAAHPRIGQKAAAGWASHEQAGVDRSKSAELAQLEKLNEEYEQRFGYIYIVCATGLTAAQMLERLRERLGSSPNDELLTAAREQEKIMELRLDKLLAELEDDR